MPEGSESETSRERPPGTLRLSEGWFVKHPSGNETLTVRYRKTLLSDCMRTSSRAIYSLVGLTLLAGCIPLEERTARFEKKWPAANITHLEIHEVNGTIAVDGNSPGEITMVATVHARGTRPDPKKEYEGYLRADLDGDTLSIATHNEHGMHFGWGKEVRVDYELHVPANVALELRTINGRIATRGIAGETSATT